ncbi:MAG TPA: M56 family metallopeptidase [Vicinamibacterales bacterium]|nr:M56 family metallopeptidase [Vicinamibacterales bacterium]
MPLFSLPMVLDLVGKATVILAVTGLVAASLRRASASARHFVWTLGLASALIAPALTIALPRWELPIVHVSAPVARSADASLPSISNPTTSESEAVRNAPPLGRATRDMTAPATPSTAQSDVRRPAWPTLALFAWILGAAAILARMLIGLAAVQWMSRRTPEVSDAPWLAAARAHADALGLRNVRFLRGAAGTMPMAWGIFRASVLVPADADTWPAHRVRVVLLHELAHVKRRDCLTHLVAQIACAAYWFNPLAWVAARRLRSERERACDDLVLAAGTRGSDYADQLLDIARVMNAGRFPAVLAGASLAMARRSQLEGRLIAILDPSVARRGLTRARAVAAATMFAIIIMAVASVQPWAEERAAVNASVADASAAPQPQIPPRPVVSTQDAIQGAVQGAVQGTVQGQVQGEIQGRTQGAVTGGVSGGVAGGVTGGVIAGVAGGIATAVTDAIVGSVAGVADEVAGELRHEFQKERIKERDKDSEQGRVRDPRTVNALMEALKDTDKDVRETAMNALVQMRDPRLFEPLVTALKDASADVREHAAFGLGQMRDARAIDPLTAALKDQSADVREQVVFALGQLRAVAAIDPLAMALHDAAADVREQAAFALGQIRDRRAVEPLISALKDEKPDVREQAAFALGQMRDAKAIEALVIALKDSNADVRAQVAFALGRIGDPRAIDGLTAALKDASAQVRQQAAFALGQIR